MALNDIVQLTITRETQAVTRAGFGTYAYIAEFETDKTTTTFDRYRVYDGLSALTDDGWLTTDSVYKAASALFSQNPKLSQILIGRKDDEDASWAAALTAVNNAYSSWYSFSIEASQSSTTVFDADFVASNSIVATVNGTAVTAVTFNADQATTMDDLKDQIEADITDASVTVVATDVDSRTLLIEIDGGQVTSVSWGITGGVSQPSDTVTYAFEDDQKAASAWAETAEPKKLYFLSSADADILDSGVSDDIASALQALSYDRSVTMYDPKSLTGSESTSDQQVIESAWPGECLPYGAGEQTWAYKTLSGVSAYDITGAQRTIALSKNCNIYTTVAGVSATENGKVAGGEWIDIIRGIDALEARIQEDIYALLVNSRKVPFDDGGITLVESTLRASLLAFAGRPGLLIADSIVITVPKYKDIASADKIARTLPDITFTATPQGAIHIVQIAGTISF